MNFISLKKSHASHVLSSQTISNICFVPENDSEDNTRHIDPPVNTSFISDLASSNDNDKSADKPSENYLANQGSPDAVKRIATLERHLEKNKTRLKRALSVIKEKNIEIIKLQERNRLYEEEKSNKNSAVELKRDFSEIKDLSESLQTRVTAIENFLKSDPLLWYDPNHLGDNHHCHYSEKNLEGLDFDLFLQQIHELNFEAGEMHICQKTKHGAAFQSCQSATLTIFANGIKLEGRPFREYSDVMTEIFIKDIMDGFYPSELQSEFPRGVIFNVQDKRNELYYEKGKSQNSVFTGQGRKLDGRPEERTVKKRRSKCNKLSKENNNCLIRNKTTNTSGSSLVIELNREIYKKKYRDFTAKSESFLISDGNGGGDCTFKYHQNNEKSILPELTIKNGLVYNYKLDINNIFQENVSDNDTKIIYLNPEKKTSKSAVQLKIRSLNDENLYILPVEITETVGKIRSILPEEIRDCDIMYYKDSLNRIYLTDNSCTLKEYGIVKNSVLILCRPRINSE